MKVKKFFRHLAVTSTFAGPLFFGSAFTSSTASAETVPVDLEPIMCVPTPDGGSQNVYVDWASGLIAVFLVE